MNFFFKKKQYEINTPRSNHYFLYFCDILYPWHCCNKNITSDHVITGALETKHSILRQKKFIWIDWEGLGCHSRVLDLYEVPIRARLIDFIEAQTSPCSALSVRGCDTRVKPLHLKWNILQLKVVFLVVFHRKRAALHCLLYFRFAALVELLPAAPAETPTAPSGCWLQAGQGLSHRCTSLVNGIPMVNGVGTGAKIPALLLNTKNMPLKRTPCPCTAPAPACWGIPSCRSWHPDSPSVRFPVDPLTEIPDSGATHSESCLWPSHRLFAGLPAELSCCCKWNQSQQKSTFYKV